MPRCKTHHVRVVGVVVALLVGLALPLLAPSVGHAAPPTVGCPGQQAPPPPAAKEETSTPSPLPWPAEPVGGAALLFGFADALQSLLSVAGTPVPIPSNFLLMLPYLATLFAVAGLVGKVSAPAADGQPYTKA